jgi:hypothetical protein
MKHFYIITKYEFDTQQIQILEIKKSKSQALNYLINSLDKKNIHKLYDNMIEVYNVNQGMIYNTKDLVYRYQIIEHSASIDLIDNTKTKGYTFDDDDNLLE